MTRPRHAVRAVQPGYTPHQQTLRTAFLAVTVLIVGAWTEPRLSLPPTPRPLATCRPIDGDTLRCGRLHVRLRGVDTPERGEPRYRDATRALAAMTAECGAITLVPHHR